MHHYTTPCIAVKKYSHTEAQLRQQNMTVAVNAQNLNAFPMLQYSIVQGKGGNVATLRRSEGLLRKTAQSY